MKLLKNCLLGFGIYILCYHVLQTIVVFGMELLDPALFSLFKEGARVLIVVASCILGRKSLKKSLHEDRVLYFVFFLLLLRTVLHSVQTGIGFTSGIIGFKYDIWPLVVIISAFVVGVSVQLPALSKKQYMRIGLFVLVGSVFRQLLKSVFPDAFMQLGYGPIGDYILGGSPPLWYRTGPGGVMRLQGFFAGPNNYGYLLVGFFSILSYALYEYWKQGKKVFAAAFFVLFIGSLIATISRGAIVGMLVQVGLLGWFFLPQWRRRLVGVVGLGVVGVAIISFTGIKQGSTIAHVVAWSEGVTAIKNNPLGYGLGSSGPSVHYEGVYLPENQYLQIAIDIGIPGLILWLSVLFMVVWYCVVLIRHPKISSHEKTLLICFLGGLIGLLVEGLFLHTFEDSMVNYLFLGVFGLVVGSVQKELVLNDV